MSRPLALALVVLAAGCGPAPTGTVTGTVRFAGQPLPNGLITFSSEVGNRDSYSAAVLNGKYTTGPIPVGPTKVTVVPRGANPADAPAKETGGGDTMPVARKTVRAEAKVPARYGAADSSGLAFDVARGENSKDFDLTP